MRRPHTRRLWTTAEDQRLRQLVLETNATYESVGRALGRSAGSVRCRAYELGCPIRRTHERTINEVARLLGIPCGKAVAAWCNRGWLPVARRAVRQRWVDYEDLLSFLSDRRYWPAWDPERITDPVLRDWAREERARAGIARYAGTRAVGDELGYTAAAINLALRQGRLIVEADVEPVKLQCNWAIPVGTSALRMRQRATGYRRGPKLSAEQRAIIAERWGRPGVTGMEIARELGYSNAVVHKVARQLGLPHLGRGAWKRNGRRGDDHGCETPDGDGHARQNPALPGHRLPGPAPVDG